MEQKISAGVFNATAEGEAMVPIEPGVEVGRVAHPGIIIGGSCCAWVPDPSRHVVVGLALAAQPPKCPRRAGR